MPYIEVLDAARKRVTMNNVLHKFAWRIDVKTKSKDVEEMSEPSTIVEMNIGPPFKSTKSDVVRFEMDQEQLSHLVKQMSNIQAQLEALSS